MPPGPTLLGEAAQSGWGDEAMPIVEVTMEGCPSILQLGWRTAPHSKPNMEYGRHAPEVRRRLTGSWLDIAWYADNSGRQPLDSTRITWQGQKNYAQILADNGNGMHEVGKKLPNSFGLYDMLGTCGEWVNDRYAKELLPQESER